MMKLAGRLCELSVRSVLGVAAASSLVWFAECHLQRPILGHPGRDEYAASTLAGEIAPLDGSHLWAGKYFKGGGFGWDSLCVAPRKGFLRWQSRDYGPPFEIGLESGSIRERNGVLELVSDADSQSLSALRNLIPVAWGRRHYSIPEADRERFCRAIASGLEPRTGRTGSFFLREGDERFPPEPLDAIRPPGLCPRGLCH